MAAGSGLIWISQDPTRSDGEAIWRGRTCLEDLELKGPHRLWVRVALTIAAEHRGAIAAVGRRQRQCKLLRRWRRAHALASISSSRSQSASASNALESSDLFLANFTVVSAIHVEIVVGIVDNSHSHALSVCSAFNDPMVAGRVWIGSKLLSARAPKPGDRGQPPGAVFCCESAFAFRDGAMTTVGSAQAVREIGGVHTSNGLGWSPCGSVMYHADSPRRRVDAYDFDARSGALSSPRVFCEIADGGVPDGLAVDAEGGVWVCVWDGGRVERWVPSQTSSAQSQTEGAEVTSGRTATRDRTLDLAAAVNVSRPTSCCFGEGAFAETLFVTSCAFDDTVEGHNAVDLAGTEPNAGAVFAVDVGVRGAPTHAAAF